MRQFVKTLLVVALPCALLWACASGPVSLPDGLPAAEIFQRAQDASERGDYTTAITYYGEVEKRYPDDIDHAVWAQYEIAFLYHKSGKNDTALTLINELLDRYQREGSSLPPAPRVLAQNLKTRLEAMLPQAK
ncbi:MAG TPA: tetratricopeptide repeat protein [Spirochaetia bacterium]